MNTHRFIEQAIKGGYSGRQPLGGDFRGLGEKEMQQVRLLYDWRQKVVLLDPLAWQAVGKAEGWEESWWGTIENGEKNGKKNWLLEWHKFIDHLAGGKSIDEAIEAIFDKTTKEPQINL